MLLSKPCLELLQELEEPRSLVSLQEIFDGRTIKAAEKAGYIMVYDTHMVMRTDVGHAAMVVAEEERK